MANADDLKRLAQEVASAYEERVKSILDIKGYTADFLAQTREEIKDREIYIENLLVDFNDSREKMGKKLRAELARFISDLNAAESERKAADQAEIKEREVYIENLLADFDKAHQEMADNLRAELAKVKPELDAAESDRKAADQAEIREREVYIENLLADFDKAHQEMADNLRAELAKVMPELDAAESERKAADQAEIKEREVYIENLLTDFDKAHQEMADNLRAELAKVKPELNAAESDRKAADQAEIKEREKTVRSMLDEFRKEQQEAAAAWKELLAGMQSLREKVTITGPAEIEAAVEVTTVDEAIEEEEPEEEEPEEEEPEEAEPEEAEPEEAEPEEAEPEEGLAEEEGLADRVIEILEDHPDGLRMVEMADILGIESWRSLIPVMRQLLDDGEVRKENSTYFIA